MPDQNPFSSGGGKKAFLVGLATSTLDAFNKQHETDQLEEKKRKDFDYQLLMDALKARVSTGNITQSEVNEIMQRGVDIFKPKGHGGIKDRLKELFGKPDPYEMQSAGIMRDVGNKPRANVAGPPTQMPATIGGAISLPPFQVPTTRPEPTLGEQDMADRERLIKAQSTEVANRQRENDVRDAAARQEDIKLRNQLTTERGKEMLGLRSDARAEATLRSKSIQFFGDDSPEHREAAAHMLKAEQDAKLTERQARADLTGIRARREDEKIDAYIAGVGSRINSTSGQDGLRYFKSKFETLKEQLQTTEASRDALLKQMQGDLSLSIDGPRKQAWQQQMDAVEQRLKSLNDRLQDVASEAVEMQTNRVTLPDAPARRGRSVSRKAVEARAAAEGIPVEKLIQALPKGTTIVP